jgi:MFS family permease
LAETHFLQIIQTYKNAYAGLSRNMWLLSLIMLINRSGTMVIAFLSIYCKFFLHFSTSETGIIVGCYGLGAIAGAFIGGKLTDILGSKKVQISSLFLGGILFMVISFLRDFYLLSVAFFILALVNESFRPANSAAILANSDDANRTRSFALIRLAMNLGWSVGTTLGGWFIDFNYSLLFWVDGITSIMAAIVLSKLTLKTELPKKIKEQVTNQIIVPPLQNKRFIYFLIVCLVFTFCFFQLFVSLPLFYKEGLHLSGFFIGTVLAANGIIIALFEMILIKAIEVKHTKKYIITIGCVLITVFFIISASYHYTNVYINAILGMCIITVGEMLTLPFMNSYYVKWLHLVM